jgi:hypothetical protein
MLMGGLGRTVPTAISIARMVPRAGAAFLRDRLDADDCTRDRRKNAPQSSLTARRENKNMW